MNVRDELVMRCALRRRKKIGNLSDQGFRELLLAVSQKPEDFVDCAADEAFLAVGRALDAYAASLREDDTRDDDVYRVERQRRLAALSAACQQAAQADPSCLDALAIGAIASEPGPEQLFTQLLDVLHRQGDYATPQEGDCWQDVFTRPALRLCFATANAAMATQRYRLCADMCEQLMDDAPGDELGAGKTCAIAYARLEDSDSFDRLDERLGRVGNTWMNLSRTILLYKLDRMPAARRALRGYGSLCEGGAYALLRPVYVEPYLPDRPSVPAKSYEEAMLCVHEAEAVLNDVPDFFAWASQQSDFNESARAFADEQGLDW